MAQTKAEASAIVARSEAALETLAEEYAAWNKAQGLDLGSADEHHFDEKLTTERRRWLREFSERWEAKCTVYTHEGVFIREEM